MNSVFRLDPKFVKELHRRLVEVEKMCFSSLPKVERRKAVPSIRHLADIISTVFWASLQFEEGRTLRFRVTYASPCPFDHLGTVFDFPGKPWRVEELRKLVPAVVPPDGQIGVDTFLDTNQLYIWGLQTTSLTNITFEALEPGRLIVSFPLRSKIAEITGEKAGFINSEWNRQGLELLSVRGEKNSVPAIEQMLSLLCGTVTQEILSRIRLLRHGGAIIFVASDDWRKSMEKPIAYNCFRALRSVPRVTEAYEETLKAVAARAATPDAHEKILQEGFNLLSDYQYRAVIGDAARNIAFLTAVDGAAVLNKEFEVLAFGAKIKETQKAAGKEVVFKVTPFEDDPEQTTLSQAFRGKRHLSAARFVSNNPGSIAFVVSQDGGITGLQTNENKQLVAYNGLELLL